MKAIVVGGGIGGLTAAIAFRRICDVEVYEQAPELTEVGAGITLWSNAIAALDQLGAADAVLSRSSAPMVDGFVRNKFGNTIGHVTTSKPVQVTGMPTVCIHRAELITALETELDQRVHTGYRGREFYQDASGVSVHFENGHVAEGDVLIGADGIRSVIREQLHGQVAPRDAGYFAWRGVADFDWPEYAESQWQLSLGPGSQFGYLPLRDGRVYWFGAKNAPADTLELDPKTAALDFYADWHAPIYDVIHATPDDGVLCNRIVDRPPLRKWGVGRVTLLGDAAHATTPNLGQGACQAMEDAVVLTRHLKQSQDIPTALQRYEADRRPRTRGVTNESYRIGKILQLENGIVRWLRDALMRMTLGTRLDSGMKYACHVV